MPKRLPDQTSASAAKPLLFILSGPSGVGKDAVLSRMKERNFPLHYVVTLTTRPRRASETDNLDYRFVGQTDFENLRAENHLLESANVYGNWYGVPRDDVETGLSSGKDTIVKVDVQGAKNIKKIMPQAVSVFLRPASKRDLAARLQKRKSESSVDLALRLKAADDEFERMADFDYVVVNEWGQIDRAVDDISWVISVERCRPRQTDDR